jgi:hypothetical protein
MPGTHGDQPNADDPKPTDRTPPGWRWRLAGVVLATVAALVLGGVFALGLILHASRPAATPSPSSLTAASATSGATLTPSPIPCPENVPSPRIGAGAAYDLGRQALVVFGGNPGVGADLGDTWTLRGGCWHLEQPSASPPARDAAVFVYDPLRRVAVLHGGGDGLTARGERVFLSDTWTWDGHSWSQVAVGSGPGLILPSGAFDEVHGLLVVFGARPGGGPETWTWNGNRWTQQTPATSAPARSDGSMGYDPVSRRVLLFGGFRNDTGVLGDTWLWDGSNWIEQHPTLAPSPRGNAAVASGHSLVLYGGGDLLSDTWIWKGSTWQQVTPAQNPGGRRPAGAASNGTIVLLFGGELRTGPSSEVLTNDVWAWDDTSWMRLQ